MKKNIKSIVTILLVINNPFIIFSQNFGIEIKTAPIAIWSNIGYYNPLYVELTTSKSNVSMHSLQFIYTPSHKISFKTGLIYEFWKISDSCSWLNTSDRKVVYDCNYSQVIKFKIINIPIIASYTLFSNKRLDYYIGIGIRFSYNLEKYRKITDKQSKNEIVSNFKQNDKIFGYILETGVHYKLTPNIYAISDISYFFQNHSLSDGHLINLSLGLGYCFK